MVTNGRIDASFLRWLRTETQARWANYVPRDFHAARVGGLDWRPGTQWRGGLANEDIRAAEERFGLRFPPDYRLFVETLHTPDPAMIGAGYVGDVLMDREGRHFVDWSGDATDIERRLEWPLEGVLWSLEADDSWRANWGPRPNTPEERAAVVRRLAAASPQLVPVAGHQYLCGPGDVEGNPVLSIYGADVIVLAPNLREYLTLVLLPEPGQTAGLDREGKGSAIPFWSDVIDGFPLRGSIRAAGWELDGRF